MPILHKPYAVNRIGRYTISVLDTLNDETMLYSTDVLERAERRAQSLVNVMKSANAVITISTTGEVVSYVEKIKDEAILMRPTDGKD
jgi:hypothetical protein